MRGFCGVLLLALAARSTAATDAACQGGPPTYAFNCMPDAKPEQGACTARGCCFIADDGNGKPFCWAKNEVGGQCPYHKNNKVNCHPEKGATKANCEARGCCWDDADEKATIWCYPKGPTPHAKAIQIKSHHHKKKEKEWGKGKPKVDKVKMPTSAPKAPEKKDVQVQRACMLVQLDPGSVETQKAVTGDVWGVYTLQYQTLNQMPVYRQHAYLCDPKKYDGSHADFSCTAKHFTKKRAPHWMYYDSQQKRWMVGKVMASKDVQVMSAISFDTGPDMINNGNWEASRMGANGELMAKREQSISTKCLKNPHATHGRSAALPTHALNKLEDSKCIRWRKTAGCDPDGPREPEQDKNCDMSIESHLSGYCECASGIRHKVACGHKPFTCHDECKIKFPHVLAQSGERTWTNQYARNLVTSFGDWLTSGTTRQWVVFDMGKATRVRAVKFTMWGSEANPKDVMVEASDKYTGPWNVLKRVTLPKLAKTYMTHIEPTTNRYWRLFFKNNWGANWGLGFNKVDFVQHLSPAKEADPCATFKSRDACVYLSVTSSNMEVAGHGRECGWCTKTRQCMSGSPTNPMDIMCDGAWLWNSLTDTYTDSCLQFSSCDKCTQQLSCGWCKASNDCRSNYCKNWAGRSCGGYGKLVAEERKEDTQLQTQYKIGAGLLSAAGLLLIPTAVLVKRRSDYWRVRRNMKDQDAQWDDDASNIVEIHSYQVDEERSGLLAAKNGGGVAVDDA